MPVSMTLKLRNRPVLLLIVTHSTAILPLSVNLSELEIRLKSICLKRVESEMINFGTSWEIVIFKGMPFTSAWFLKRAQLVSIRPGKSKVCLSRASLPLSNFR